MTIMAKPTINALNCKRRLIVRFCKKFIVNTYIKFASSV
ncbi:MAG: hypothetical protein ACI9A0_001040 [Pseudoalteromonas tetraodonis]